MLTATIILSMLLSGLFAVTLHVRHREIQAQRKKLHVQIKLNAQGMASNVKKEGKKLMQLKKQWETPAGIYNNMYTFLSKNIRLK